jgi:LysM repeat protein
MSPTHPEEEEWLRTAEGVKMNPDGRFGLQCVDPIDEFAQVLTGVPWPTSVGGVNGARELLDRVPDQFWERHDNNPNDPHHLPQRGDWLVYGGDGTNPHGHVCVALSVDLSGADVLQQDGYAEPRQFVDGAWYSARPMHRARLGWHQRGTGSLLGWLRLRAEHIRDTGAAARLAPAAPRQCIVEAGDTMGLIALQFGVELGALIAANPQVTNPDRIEVGQVLNLP